MDGLVQERRNSSALVSFHLTIIMHYYALPLIREGLCNFILSQMTNPWNACQLDSKKQISIKFESKYK